jgi:hypothetical protein
MRHYLRYLRIVFSAICGIACVLLVVLWVRSLRAEDRLTGHFSGSQRFRLYSSRGCLVWYVPGTPGQPNSYLWGSDFGSKFWLEKSDPRIASVPRIHHHPQESWVTLPHWLLVGVCATFAVVPWIHWRFSLRTLLIAITLIGLILGTIITKTR